MVRFGKRVMKPDLVVVPLVTMRCVVPADWADFNGHMNEGRYGQVFSDAAEVVMAQVGADAAYVAAGMSYFTVETTIKFLMEIRVGEALRVDTRVTHGEGKKLRVFHEMRREADESVLATCDQFMLHVSLDTRRSCNPPAHIAAAVEALARAHTAASTDKT